MTSHQRPRRWTETLGGVRWLPRLIDKARMSADGDLGLYLFGHSPVDKALLRRLGLTTHQFAKIVAENADDKAILAVLRAHRWDEARLTRWSERLPRRHPLIIGIIDTDEGYRRPTPIYAALKAAFNTTAVIGLIRAWMMVP